jgi:hypothetical protein
MASIGIRTISLLSFALTLATGLETRAADYIVLGKRLLVKNPTGLEKNRTVIVLGKEAPTDLPTFDNGPPITASLRVILNGRRPPRRRTSRTPSARRESGRRPGPATAASSSTRAEIPSSSSS